MSEQSSTRSEQTVQMGQEAMKILFKEPIKEAVKESLAEEGLIKDTEDEQTELISREEPTDERSPRILNLLIPAAALLGVALALRRLNEGELDPEQVTAKIRGDDETTMEEDMSKSTGSDPGRSQFAEDDSEEVNV